MTVILINDANPPVAGGVYDLTGNVVADQVTLSNSPAISPQVMFFTYAGADTFNFATATGSYQATIFSGSGTDFLDGGLGVETAYDGAGGDTLKLGGNNDTLFAGAGNDTYDGGAGLRDTLWFYYAPTSSNKGDPRANVNTVGVTVDLSKSTAQTTIFGSDIIKGFENITGGNGADNLTGNALANTLSGQGGNDTIKGLGGKDLIFAGAGRDTLTGGGGADEINVSSDTTQMQDKIRYLVSSDSTVTAFDTIVSFKGGGTLSSDRIDLSALLGATKLTYLHNAALTAGAGGQVRWQLVNDANGMGKDIAIFIDTDLDAAAEMKILVDGATSGLLSLVKGDFIL